MTAALAALVLLAVGARLWLLVARALWHDELFTLWAARLPLAKLLEALRHDSGPPLFYLLEKPIVLLAEAVRSDALARLLPFAATVLLFFAARSLPRKGGRAWFLMLAASSPLLLVYAAEARAYALLALLDLLLFLLLFRGEPTPGRLAGGAAAVALALWTHYLALFFVLAAAFRLATRRSFRALGALLVGALLFLPWTPVLAVQPREATAWMREAIGDSLLAFVAALGGAGRIPDPLGGPLPSALVWAGAAAGVALAVAVALASRRDPACADAAILTLLTMVFVLGASLARPVGFGGRTEMAVLPIWLWAVSRGAAAGRKARWLAGAGAALAAVSSLLLLARPSAEPRFSSVLAPLEQFADRQDRVVATGAFYLPARLASDRGDLAAPVTAFPPELAIHPGWIGRRPPSEADYRDLEASLLHLSPGRRIFVALDPGYRTPRLSRLLSDRGVVRVMFERPDAVILVCTER